MREPTAIVVPLHGGRRGHGSALLPCDDPGVLQDIDLPEQLPMPAR